MAVSLVSSMKAQSSLSSVPAKPALSCLAVSSKLPGPATTHSNTATSSVPFICQPNPPAVTWFHPTSWPASWRSFPLTSHSGSSVPPLPSGAPSFVISATTPRHSLLSIAILVTFVGSQAVLRTTNRTLLCPSFPTGSTLSSRTSSLGEPRACQITQSLNGATSASRYSGGGFLKAWMLSHPPSSMAPSCGCANGYQST